MRAGFTSYSRAPEADTAAIICNNFENGMEVLNLPTFSTRPFPKVYMVGIWRLKHLKDAN